MDLGLPQATSKGTSFQPVEGTVAEKERAVILVVDDENGPRQALRMVLKEEYEVFLTESVPEGLAVLEKQPVNLIISDIRMPKHTGMDLLREVRTRFPDVEVIMLTGYGELDTAMEAIEFGAYAYIEKPFDHEAMLKKVESCLEKQRLEHDRRAMERLAMETNRFETLGRMVSGTMHDLGTPLSVLGTNLELLMGDPAKPGTPRRLRMMHEQVRHCNDLVRTAMNFLRQPPRGSAPFGLNCVAELCLEIARPVLRKHEVAVETKFRSPLARSRGELVLVRQAVLNLVYNACQAMEGQPAPRKLLIETYREGDRSCLAVEDSGPGIAPADRHRVFNSMFSTKGKQGTGLGLTVVRNVMHRHGGEALLAPTEARGARFVLKFPMAGEDAEAM